MSKSDGVLARLADKRMAEVFAGRNYRIIDRQPIDYRHDVYLAQLGQQETDKEAMTPKQEMPMESPVDDGRRLVSDGDLMLLLVRVSGVRKTCDPVDGTNAVCEVVTPCPRTGFRPQFAIHTRQARLADYGGKKR